MSEQGAIVHITREQVVAAARTLLGIPWVHQGLDPEFGLDCRGVLLCTGKLIGYEPKEYRATYRRRSPAEELRAALDDEMDEIGIDDVRDADVVLIKFPRDTEARHVGIIATGEYEQTIIHGYEPKQGGGRVVEEPFRRWKPYVVTPYRWRGIAD